MSLKILAIGCAALGSVAVAQPAAPTANIPKNIAKVLSRGDGASEQTAYKVRSVQEEYQVLHALNLTPGKQSLVLKKKAYDVIEATDERTGVMHEVWFDISSFAPGF